MHPLNLSLSRRASWPPIDPRGVSVQFWELLLSERALLDQDLAELEDLVGRLFLYIHAPDDLYWARQAAASASVTVLEGEDVEQVKALASRLGQDWRQTSEYSVPMSFPPYLSDADRHLHQAHCMLAAGAHGAEEAEEAEECAMFDVAQGYASYAVQYVVH